MTIKPFFAGAAANALALFLISGLGTAAAAELSSREIRKLGKQAERALKAGQDDEAAGLYQQLLDATPAGDARRQDALWAVALTRLTAAPDDEAGRTCLQELTDSFSRHPRHLEVAAMQAALAALDGTRAEIDGVRAQLEAAEAERQKVEQEQEKIAGESEEADDRVRSLESQLRRVRAELASTKEELDKKEEALQRLLKLRSERGSG